MRPLFSSRPSRPARLLAAGAAAVLLVAVPACGSDSKDSGTKKSTTTTATTAATSSTTTSSPSSTTTSGGGDGTSSSTTDTTSGDAALPTTPEAYAQGLIDAWAAGDSAAGSRYADPIAQGTLFGLEPSGGEDPSTPATWTLQGCEGAAGSTYCTFKAGGTVGVTLRLVNELVAQGAPQAVVEVQVNG